MGKTTVLTSSTEEIPEELRRYFYGNCPEAKPRKKDGLLTLHYGYREVPYVRDDSIIVIGTMCGNQIFIDLEKQGMRPPLGYFDPEALCGLCNRTNAFREMVENIKHRQSVEDKLAFELDTLAARIETNELNDIGIVRELRAKAERLRYSVQPLSSGEDRPKLALIAGSA